MDYPYSIRDDRIPYVWKYTGKLFTLAYLLNITLYGPFNLFEEIGSYFEGYEAYLQDPLQSGNLTSDIATLIGSPLRTYLLVRSSQTS